MNAKKLGIVGAIGSPIIGIAAYGFYYAGKPIFAVIWGTIAVICAVCTVINFRTACRQSRGG